MHSCVIYNQLKNTNKLWPKNVQWPTEENRTWHEFGELNSSAIRDLYFVNNSIDSLWKRYHFIIHILFVWFFFFFCRLIFLYSAILLILFIINQFVYSWPSRYSSGIWFFNNGTSFIRCPVIMRPRISLGSFAVYERKTHKNTSAVPESGTFLVYSLLTFVSHIHSVVTTNKSIHYTHSRSLSVVVVEMAFIFMMLLLYWKQNLSSSPLLLSIGFAL